MIIYSALCLLSVLNYSSCIICLITWLSRKLVTHDTIWQNTVIKGARILPFSPDLLTCINIWHSKNIYPHSRERAIFADQPVQPTTALDLILPPIHILLCIILSWQSPHSLPRASMTLSMKQINLDFLRNASLSTTSAPLLTPHIFSPKYHTWLLSFCRTREPTADHGISPLWQLERLSHETQRPLWFQETAALCITDLQGNVMQYVVQT